MRYASTAPAGLGIIAAVPMLLEDGFKAVTWRWLAARLVTPPGHPADGWDLHRVPALEP
jgi:hypothetical protein